MKKLGMCRQLNKGMSPSGNNMNQKKRNRTQLKVAGQNVAGFKKGESRISSKEFPKCL
jgi:hypothetical protein